MTLAAVKSAIEELPEEERGALIAPPPPPDREEWDRQIAEDFAPGGRGSSLLEEVDAAIDRGDFKPL
jgi:hypothetical protein